MSLEGLDDAQKLHGLGPDFAWINEAIEADKDDFDQLEMRCTGTMFLDCNPSEEESWVYDLKKRDDVVFLHSTHLNNAFLPIKIRRKILGMSLQLQILRLAPLIRTNGMFTD